MHVCLCVLTFTGLPEVEELGRIISIQSQDMKDFPKGGSAYINTNCDNEQVRLN